MGMEEVASYRTRRAWALGLARAGHPTLRFDLPGTGNSSGSPRDPDLAERWVLAVAAASAWLQDAAGAQPVVGLGLGLGGLLAIEALVGGAVLEELILWAAPTSGSAFVREAKSFSRLQRWNAVGTVGEDGAEPAAGWIEASGFVLSSETRSALENISPEFSSSRRPRRVLLLGRYGTKGTAGLRQRLEAVGSAVEVASGKGWGAMVSHPERSQLPLEVVERVGRWLADCDSAQPKRAESAAERPPRSLEAAELELEVEGCPVLEAPLAVALPFGQTFGILARPSEERQRGLCAIYLNAGAVRDSGPNRMWVERSRAWAARGVPSLRIDLEDIGEADGAPGGVATPTGYFAGKYEAQIEAVLDALGERYPEADFLLVGLCSGAYFAFRTALADDRVRAAFLINAAALIWRPELLSEREARKALRLLQREWLRKLISGEVGWRKLGVLLKALVGRVFDLLRRQLRRRGRPGSWKRELEVDLDLLEERGTQA